VAEYSKAEQEKPLPPVTSAVYEPKTSPRQSAETSRPVTVVKTQSVTAVANRNYSYLTVPLLVIFACLALAFVMLLVLQNTSTTASLINSSFFNGREHGPAYAEFKVAKPGSAVVAPEIVLPTATPLAAATTPELPVPPAVTAATLPTETPLVPQDTPVPTLPAPTLTATPVPTETLLPTASPTATAEMALMEGPSPTPLPTDTAMPVPTRYVAPTAGTNNASAGLSGERWIDVDLTHQTVSAYQGNTAVNSFVVSTGTWQHPTVTGQYQVYIKLRSTTMSGPGYSLPNVPYTMYFYKGYGIHGTYWHNNFGTPMSHGCVNLTIPDAEWLYNWASVGTLVNVHY
jgi:lipoprotein-anchoring transpeptidase ErfK/SrfK